MNKPPRWKVALMIVSLLFGNFIIISAAFYINSFIYNWIDSHPSNYVLLMTTNIIGLILFIVLVNLISKSPRKKQIALYLSIIDALKKISQGDFNVHLDFKLDPNHQFLILVENINHMAKQLKEMEEMRQEFISNVSHEIQSPLTSISGFASALQYEELSREDQKHYLGIIEAESKRLSKLSDNLLKLTSLESEQHPFERKVFRLDKQLRKIILLFEPQWAKKKLEMDITLQDATIFADEDLLSQVWNNLIHNSIKFTHLGGTIRIQLEDQADNLIIRIFDTGIGISEDGQIHIFERFYKADKARNRMKGGSGLGLSIVKKIIEMHDGKILVTSQIDKGTTFTVILPKGVY
jgi:two-component system, OmpR family, phosphate regulon sensor histidine kinase PhoR